MISASPNMLRPAWLWPGCLLGRLSSLVSLESWRVSLSIPLRQVETVLDTEVALCASPDKKKGRRVRKF